MRIGPLHRRCISVVVICVISQLTFLLDCQAAARTEVRIPNIPGYLVLKCDFHMHTVFSDGAVWPSIRAEEAWREGLDAFAITDHIEYQPHEEDVRTNHNRSYEIAQSRAKTLGLKIIKAGEITRDMPPGHFNAI
ncbi:MAG: PHP domain-containing protein, partial [Planctomycetota bacterium]